MITRKTALSAGAAFFAVPAAIVMACGPAAAAGSSDVVVSNTETIQAYLNASGKVDVARIYEQVAMRGKGTVDLRNPVEAKGLRNLDGFGGFEVKDGAMVGSYAVDGERRLRSVSDYTRQLPLEVDVRYVLDGKEVKPGDVVGRSGTLQVEYTVRNVTGKPQEVTFDDGTGKQASATEDVVVPMVGSLTTVLPAGFTDVRSAEANMAGDGHGGTKMSFTMTLFGPIGKPEATFGYTAKISDGVVPSASISALPVSPLDSPSFKGGAESYKGGAATGAELTAGATEIDANLLKLRDGAADLLAGLIKLRDGASQLNAGLAGSAAPGAATLADGAGKAAAGAGDLSSGVGQLDDGAKKLSAGTKDLRSGTSQVADGAGQLADATARASAGADDLAAGSAQVAGGLEQAGQKAPALIEGLTQVSDGLTAVDAGLAKMYDSVGGLDQNPGVVQMHQGMRAMIAGLGSKSDQATLIGGVDALRASLAEATKDKGKIDELKQGIDDAAAGAKQVKDGVTDAVTGVDSVNDGLKEALAPGGGIAQLAGGVALAQSLDCGPGCQQVLAQVAQGVDQLKTDTATASGGLARVSGGLSGRAIPGLVSIADGLSTKASPGVSELKSSLLTAVGGLTQIECGLSSASLSGLCDPKRPGLLEGIGSVDAGVSQLVNGVIAQVQGGVGTAKDTGAEKPPTLRGGVHALQAGVDALTSGGQDLVSGLGLLSAGAGLVAEGNASLSDGMYQIAGGAGDLADGAGQLDDGASRLEGGAGQLADGTARARIGAGQLADGNRRLADGADELSSGLRDAADGSGRLEDGLEQAAEGAPKIKDGAQQLSDQGTRKLVEAGKATAADYGQKYALIEAGAQRAKAEGMAYGAPEGAAGNTAYSLELSGMDGEGGRNLGRGLGAALVFGFAGGAAALRRKLI